MTVKSTTQADNPARAKRGLSRRQMLGESSALLGGAVVIAYMVWMGIR